ncbi:MAG: ERF family protein [Planctomycetes bacterium]|nr:ERF family protein [Planctomycetota bacterium]
MADDTLVAALARAQLNMPPIAKNHENPHFKSRYADIADVLAVVRPVLAKEGIAITQTTRVTDAGCELVTCLLKGDDRLESAMPLQIDQKAQDLGSRLTYLRRYALCALVGVAAEDDDDGHAASNAPPRTKTRQAAQEPRERSYVAERGETPRKPVEDGGKPASDAQVRFLEDLATQQGWSDAERDLVFKKLAGIISDPITKATASALIPELKRIAKKELVVEWDENGKPRIVTAVEAAISDGEEPF